MTSEPDPKSTSNTETGGGTYVGGNVDAGKDFVGRDQNNYNAESITIVHSNVPLITNENEPPAPGESPYRGMEYFDVGDADLFFGREQLTAELIEHLRHNRLLAIVGASGSGKSSLARAGLIPALQGTKPLIDDSQPPKGSSRWAYHIITPTARPLESLAASLTRHSESVTATSTLIDDLRKDARSLHLAARRLVSGDQRLLLLVDQFEELFTLCKDESEQQAFVANLLHAAQHDGVVTLVLTLRADFYQHCARFPDLRNALESQQKYIGVMRPDELRRAIEEPAKAGKWELQEGLVDQLLNDVGDEPGALPLLSHALLETWKRRSGRRMTLTGYMASGRVQGAIAKSADAIYKGFSETQQRIARTIFLRLTELGEGSQDTRRRVRPAELKLTHTSQDEVQTVLKILADARLVATGDNEVQVAHEALIRAWETLRSWLDDDREGSRIQRRLTIAANQWIEFNKDNNLLYRGVLLEQAQKWLQSTVNPPNQIESEFLSASQADAKMVRQREVVLVAERENNNFRLRKFNRYLIVLLFFLAVFAWDIYEKKQIITIQNKQITGTNETLTKINAEMQLNLDKLTDAKNILEDNLVDSETIVTRIEHALNILTSKQLALQSAKEFESSHLELSKLLAIEAGKSSQTFEAFSALYTGNKKAWHNRMSLQEHSAKVNLASWNHNSSKFVTSSEDKTARIWDITNGDRLTKLIGHTSTILQALWSKNDDKILTCSNDGTSRIWDVKSGKVLQVFSGYNSPVIQCNWSHDEKRVLTRSANQTIGIWDATLNDSLARLAWHVNGINQAVWSKDDSKILTTSDDGVTRIWDSKNGNQIIQFRGHNGSVRQALWDPNEDKILTYGGDNTAIIWNANDGKELYRINGVIWAVWNPLGTKILTNSPNNILMTIDIETGQELAKLEPHIGAIYQVSWSLETHTIIAFTTNGSEFIWDETTGSKLFAIEGFSTDILLFKWSQNEGTAITSDGNGSIYVWTLNIADMIKDTCTTISRNFTWAEWKRNFIDDYHVSCPNLPIPPDAIIGIQNEARQQILAGQPLSGTQRLEELNRWLKENGQFDSFGVKDVQVFVAEVSATATAEPLPPATPTMSGP